MSLILSEGFENGYSVGVLGSIHGRSEPAYCSIEEEGSSSYLSIDTNMNTTIWEDRGIIFHFNPNSQLDDVWIGAKIRTNVTGLTKVLTVVTIPEDRYLTLFIDNSREDGVIRASSGMAGAWETHNNTSAVAESPQQWEFNPGGVPVWRFLKLHFFAEDELFPYRKSIQLFVDGQEILYIPGTAMAFGDPISRVQLAGLTLTGNQTGAYVHHDDLWIATEDMDQFQVRRVQPIEVGTFNQATVEAESGTPPTLIDAVDDFPPDINTYASVYDGDAVSFLLDTTEISRAREIPFITVNLTLGGPGSVAVIAHNGTGTKVIDYVDVAGMVPILYSSTITENPFTGEKWNYIDFETLEIGVRSEVKPPTWDTYGTYRVYGSLSGYGDLPTSGYTTMATAQSKMETVEDFSIARLGSATGSGTYQIRHFIQDENLNEIISTNWETPDVFEDIFYQELPHSIFLPSGTTFYVVSETRTLAGEPANVTRYYEGNPLDIDFIPGGSLAKPTGDVFFRYSSSFYEEGTGTASTDYQSTIRLSPI